jgi:hypothetical protein
MVCEQAEGLDVEEEAGRGSFYPEVGVAFRRQGVVGRIHLDDGELAGIMGQSVGGSPRAGRIERAGVNERPIGPAAGAIVDGADRLARLERRRRVRVRKLHAAPVRRSAGRAGADRLPATTAKLPFCRDSAANPINDVTTGGRHSAITLAACSNLPSFRIPTPRLLSADCAGPIDPNFESRLSRTRHFRSAVR